VNAALAELLHGQGRLFGKLASLGFSVGEDVMLSSVTDEIIGSFEIEGEKLDYKRVRSSVASRLGIEDFGMVKTDRDMDGIVEMMLDAVMNCNEPLTHERLFGWHATMFPYGRSGMYKITPGEYRKGDMQVVSGGFGRETVHYEAPPPERVPAEMDEFIRWVNEAQLAPAIKAGLAHFKFVTIHPFDDGNGRIARAIADMLMSRSEGESARYYSMSARIMAERKAYYDALEDAQSFTGDVTDWLIWFTGCAKRAMSDSEKKLDTAIRTAEFWDAHAHTEVNERQRLMLNKLLTGFVGKLTTSKWAKITKTSQDTALRDINDLIAKEILTKEPPSGRSTSYTLLEMTEIL
jgi:Fic family protein